MQLISIKTAKLAAKKGLKPELDLAGELLGYGIDEEDPYPSSYHVHISFPSKKEWLYAPYQAELQRWLRDEHKFHIEIGTTLGEKYKTEWILYRIEGINKNQKATSKDILERFDTYEEALERGLCKALKLIKS